MKDEEFEKIEVVVNKINKLIQVYAKKKGLEPYLRKTVVYFENRPLDIYKILIADYCADSKDNNMKYFYDMLRSFATSVELENLLMSRYFPDYLTIKNIFDILIYKIPREIQKSDFEFLNKLYKKYNMKFQF